jgi:hypothetical protein
MLCSVDPKIWAARLALTASLIALPAFPTVVQSAIGAVAAIGAEGDSVKAPKLPRDLSGKSAKGVRSPLKAERRAAATAYRH